MEPKEIPSRIPSFLSDQAFFAFVGLLVFLGGVVWEKGEEREWLVWSGASFLTVFFVLRSLAGSPPLRVSTRRFFGVLCSLGLVYGVLVRGWQSSSLSDFFISVTFFSLCAASVERAIRPFFKAAPSGFRALPLLTASMLVFAVTRLSYWQQGFLGPFSQIGDWVLPVALLIACVMLGRFLSYEPSLCPKPWKATLVAALGFGAASLLTPITPYIAAHHWSFYLGPLSLVQAGGHLLHSVPSQYGFGSILALALLPFESVTSMYTAVWACSLAFAVLVLWNTLKCLDRNFGLTFFAVLGVFSAVYILPGWIQGAVGPFAYPSVTGFRFFWSALMAVWVPSLYSQPRRPGESVLFALAFACASFWAFESFLYTVAVFGFSLVGASAHSWRVGSFMPLKCFGQRILAPALFGLATALALTCLIYQWKWGIWPDAYAFIEFPKAYSNGFGTMRIAWHSTAVFLSFVVWAIGVSCVVSVERNPFGTQNFSLNPFSAMGYTLGVLTYFVSRSHDNNAVNLVPSMVLGLSMAVSSLPREPLSPLASKAKPVVRALWFLTIAFSLALGLRHFPLQTKTPLQGLNQVLTESLVGSGEVGVLEGVRARVEKGQRFSVAPNGPDFFSSGFLPFVAGLPMAPPAEYAILSRERQVVYWERWSKLPANKGASILAILWPSHDCRWPPPEDPFGSYLKKSAASAGPCEAFGSWSIQSVQMRGDP